MVCVMSTAALDDVAVASGSHGTVIRPGDVDYDDARSVYNAMIDRHPRAVVVAGDVTDVIAGVIAARERGLDLSVRGGAHGVAGFATNDDGIVIDLSRMRAVRIDRDSRIVRVEGGCTWGDLDRIAHHFGLGTTGGTVSTTGVAGLALGGGFGFLARKYGLACDNLIGVDIVTADGELVHCDDGHNADLMWALRGGGGNFGVVTSFQFRLHDVGEIIGGPTFYAFEPRVLERYRDLLLTAPRDLGLIGAITRAPAIPVIDQPWHGQPVIALLATWTGDPDAGRALLDTMTQWGTVVGRDVGALAYPVMNTLFDDLLPPGLQHYWKGAFVPDLPDGAIEVHMEHGRHVPGPESAVMFFPLDGASQDVGPADTAFAHRDAAFAIALSGAWPDPADNDANRRWVREYAQALAPYGDGTCYVNFTSDDDGGRASANYGTNYDRLARIKSHWDPGNLFHLNQNIVPA
jgi:FAD binding domain/Berberine and berberine like